MLTAGCVPKSTQLLCVTTDEHNASRGIIEVLEEGRGVEGLRFAVLLGQSGVAPFGEKREGDGHTPAGHFDIGPVFAYGLLLKLKMPQVLADEALLCIDDPNSDDYNTLVHTTERSRYASYEKMRRADGLYAVGAVIGYNTQREKGKGSCIFLHIACPDGSPMTRPSLSSINILIIDSHADCYESAALQIHL